MILLDPDLDPDVLPPSQVQAKSAPRTAPLLGPAAGDSGAARSRRLPSPRTLARFLGQAQSHVRLPGRVSVLLTTDSALRRLNRRFRKIDQPTDVLSFPADAGFGRRQKIAGDLAISVPTARRQAAQHGHPVSLEIKILILHGLLHLAGYDHESDSGQMARRERRLRALLGLPLGLIERVHSGAAAGPGRRPHSSSQGARS